MSRATFIASAINRAAYARNGLVSMAVIAASEAGRAGITTDQLMGRSSARLIAHARQDAMRRIREALGYSYPRIGRFFGRDHTTVVHGVRASAARAGGEG